MKKISYMLITCICILSFLTCGIVQTSAAGQTKTTSGSTTKTETTTKSSKDDSKKASSKEDAKKSSNETELYKKYEQLISFLEDGDYESAYGYINKLNYEAKKKSNEEADDAAVMDIVVGDYIDPESKFTVTINPDYTIEYENTSKFIKIIDLAGVLKNIDAKKDFSLLITSDGTSGRDCQFDYNNTLGTYVLSVYDSKDQWHELVKKDQIEIVDLTVENYGEYFEIVNRMTCHRDAFGEVTDTFVGRTMVLKDGIKAYKGNGAVAFSFVEKEFKVLSVDEDAETIELGEPTGNVNEPSENSAKIHEEMVYNDGEEEVDYIGCDVTNGRWGLDKDKMTVRLADDIEVTRIEGTLYLVRDSDNQKKEEASGEIDDYLVTVDLNSENFEDYFEFVTIPKYNGFGEIVKDCTVFGVKSKKYDDGLIVYSMDDITVEYTYSGNSGDTDLKSLLYFGNESWSSVNISYGGRITDGKVTFIKQEYVEEYDIPEKKKPDEFAVTTFIQLKNGESISRTLQPEYPY